MRRCQSIEAVRKSIAAALSAGLLICLLLPGEVARTDVSAGRGEAGGILAGLPISFEPNRGQVGAGCHYLARTAGYTALFGDEGVDLLASSGEAGRESAVGLRFSGGTKRPRIEPLDELPGRSSYFQGNDEGEWVTDVPTYQRLGYRNLYPGIDLIFYGHGDRIEYDFVVTPGADPRRIRIRMEGVERMETDAAGNLLLRVGGRIVHRMLAPVIYQKIDESESGAESRRGKDAGRRYVVGRYVVGEDGEVGFEVGDYERTRPLVIDPIIEFAGYLGGAGLDIGYAMAVDGAGNIYIAGQTSSSNFPVRGALFSSLNGANDAFIVKINAQRTAVLFSTFLGGRNPGDRIWAMAVDDEGRVYVCGETNSVNFPTVNPAQPFFRGNIDAFVSVVSSSGSSLLYSSMLGGSFQDVAYGMVIDSKRNIYLTGGTRSPNFPLVEPFQSELKGPKDAFVTMLSAAGEIVFSTFLGGPEAGNGGTEEELGYAIGVDPAGNIYAGGLTCSAGFPVVRALQPAFGGVEDGFVTRIDRETLQIGYSTYLGGSRADNVRALAVNSFGEVYVTGYSISLDFPQVGSLQPYRGNIDGIVARLSAAGDRLIFSGYLGGSGPENTGIVSDLTPSCAIAIDRVGNVYVGGKTASVDFPVVLPVQTELRGSTDGYLGKIDPAGSSLLFSSFLGSGFAGENGLEERVLGLAIDRAGGIHVTGQVLQNDLSTTLPLQPNYGGGVSDAFVARITTPDLVTVAPVSAASYQGAAIAPESIVAVFGPGLAGGTVTATSVPLPTELAGTTVTVEDRLGVRRQAPLFFVSAGQINLQIPPGTATGRATLTVSNRLTIPGGRLSAAISVSQVAPGLFAASADGAGVAAALLLRVRENGTSSYEPVARITAGGGYEPLPIDPGPATDSLFLVLFGTGWRLADSSTAMRAAIGGIETPVLYAGPQGSFVGLDQINIPLPRQLAGRGEVTIRLTADGMLANLLSVTIR